jgi:hypothetical protein
MKKYTWNSTENRKAKGSCRINIGDFYRKMISG